VLFGGDAGGTRLTDTWAYYPIARAWDAPPNAQTGAGRPPGTRSAAIAAAPDGRSLFLFGGDAQAVTATADMYSLAPRGFESPDPVTEFTNIALSRPTTSSSIYKIIPLNPLAWAAPELAVDGLTSQNLLVLGRAQCFHSNATGTAGTGQPGERAPWWRVDLGAANTAFEALTIYGRTSQEAGPGRYAGLEVWTGNSAAATAPNDPANTRCWAGDLPAGELRSALPCIPPTGGARFVWVALAPVAQPTQFLSLCEVQVLQRRLWVWRKLSGSGNVALGKPAFASSIFFNGAVAGAPELATDGILTTAFPFMSQTRELQPACNNIFLTVDLLAEYEVTQALLYSRLEACCASRMSRMEMYVGNSRDWQFNRRVMGPLDVTPPGAAQFFTQNINRVRGRYVTVRRRPFDEANCANAPTVPDDKNVLHVAELQVIASLMLDQPSPRYGVGVAAYRGNMVIFGGQDGSGFRLNDVRFFDMATRRWAPPAVPLGTPPLARAFAFLLPLPANASLGPLGTLQVPSTALALTGGSSVSGDAIGDFMTEINVTSPTCFQEIKQQTGFDVAEMFIAAVEAAVK